MDVRNRPIRTYLIWFLMPTVLIVPIKAARVPSPGDTAAAETEQTARRIIADDLTDAERQTLERFAARLEGYRKQLNIPGMSAAVIRDRQLIWAEGFGYADVENKVPATPETPYHLASLTKTFASQVIMKLVEEGKIALDDSLKEYGVQIPDDPGITVRHLFTHTSEGRPGSNYKYNGHRFGFLGRVIEKASGQSFGELVTAQILEPAGMTDTAPVLPRSAVKDFNENQIPTNAGENVKRINRMLAKPYALNDAFELVPGRYPNPDHFGVSTGLISNVIDMAKYDKAIDDYAFISKPSQELAFTPAVSNSRKTLPYGLGWFVQDFAGTKLLWHYGWEINYSALILKVPQENVAFVIFANTDYLSRAFNLGAGDVLNSPLAVEFLKSIALKDRFSELVPQIEWQAEAGDIISQLAGVKDKELKELLKRELISNLMLNHHLARSEHTKKLMDVYIRMFTRDEFKNFGDLAVIASIDNVTDRQYRMVEFTLERDTPVRVYAIGEGVDNCMVDFGGIENAETGQLIWEMYAIFAEHAGGALKNRKVDRIIPLPAGAYRLHYRTDPTHSFDNWNNLPPDHYWWGIRLFNASEPAGRTAAATWEKARAPEQLGWSSSKLKALESDLRKLQTAALMIVTDGKVVFEWGKTTNNIYSHSTRKSLLSALYGIYATEGKIDTSMTLAELGIQEKVPLTEEEKQAKVIDLLKARSGVYIPAAAEAKSMRDARPKRGSHEPGTHWYYNNWDFNVLGTIFREQTGEDIYEAFAKRIAEPIGMQDYVPEKQRYSFEENFSIHPAYPFLISARDMARFGQLFLQRGQWKGRQIIPADWVRGSTRSYSDTGRSWRGYGYLWWTIERNHAGMKEGDYFASGYGGQKVFVLPRINTVVVHRINVYLPGIDVAAASNAPFQLMPKIMQAYTGEKEDVRPTLAGKIAPQRRLLPDYTRILGIKERIEARRRVMAWSWLILTAACLVFLVLDLAIGARASWWMRLVCILVTALFGLLGLIVYLIAWRQTLRQPEREPSLENWRLALGATLCTMLVYIAAMVLVIVFFVALDFSGTLPSVLIVGYVVPVILALLVVRAPLVVSRVGVTYGLAVRRTLLVEIISVNLALAAAVPAFFFLKFRWFSDLAPDLSSPLFWFMISLVAIAGAVLLYPFHIWLCRRGFGSVLIHFRTGHEADENKAINTPNLRNAWYVLVISIALLLASIGLMVQNVP